MAEAEGTMGEIKERLRALANKTGYGDPLAAIDLIDSLEKQRDEARAKAIEECAGVLYGMRSQRRDREIELKELGQYGLGGLDTLDEAINAIRALNVGDLREADEAIKEAGK